MRADRIITLNIVQPCRRVASGFKSWGSAAGSAGRYLPVLMYHSIADQREPGVPAYFQTTTRPMAFAHQMSQLKASGFQGVDLSRGLAWLNSDRQDSGLRPVAITFDDGFRNFLTEAFPVLRREGFGATMFLPTAFINEPRRRFKDLECLTWDEVKDMRKAGMEFGSHTVNHPRLVELSRPEIEKELRDSKSELEQRLGERVATFAYPYAFPQSDRAFCQSLRELLVQAGYDCCMTTEIGRVKAGDDPYTLKRLPVNSLDDAALFEAKLAGHYDWLGTGQATVKVLKRLKGRSRRKHSGTAH